jgi:hypothetical protein
MTTPRAHFVQTEKHWHLVVDGRFTDVGVAIARGYQVYKRAPSTDEVAIADTIGDMIGKRVVAAPKHTGQITEAALLAAITGADWRA